jgi:pimeloyl-ACP methyl ester carboxylesterase
MNHDTQITQLPDGRQLAYAEFGSPTGLPIIYCHGFPGSRLEAHLFDEPARRHNLRMIAPDRNGLGLSDPYPGRGFLDWASDMDALADNLEIERFFLIGISGGGPYAMAYAHHSAYRLNGISLVCPLGPLNQPALLKAMRWPAQINFRPIHNTLWFSNLAFRLAVVPLAQRWPQLIYQVLLSMVPSQDMSVLNLPQVRETIIASLRESIRQGGEGVLEETRIYTEPWGFDPAGIALPVQLWHGVADDTVPILHSHLLSMRLPNCQTHFIEDESHFSLPIKWMDKILAQLIAERII